MKKQKKKKKISPKVTQDESRNIQLKNVSNQKQSNQISPKSNKYGFLDDKIDQAKIIKGFQMKRKLLMKALKRKQKRNSLQEVTLDVFQIKEGSSEKLPVHHNNYNSGTSAKIQSVKLEKLAQIPEPTQQRLSKSQKNILNKITSKKVSVGVQASNYLLKPKKTNQNNLLSHLTPQAKIIDQKGEKIRPQKNKSIQKIKQHVKNLFNKRSYHINNQMDIQNLSNSIHSSSSEFQNHQQYQKISLRIQKINEQIQNYYASKLIKKLVLKKFQDKFKKINKKPKSLILLKEKEKINFLRKSLRTNIRRSSQFSKKYDQLNGNQQINHLNFQKNRDFKQIKKSSNNVPMKAINQRFRLALMKNQDIHQIFVQQKNNLKQQQPDIVMKKKQKSSKIKNKGRSSERSFDATETWITQFKNISKILYEKYSNLKDYVNLRRKIEYQRIYSKIRKQTNRLKEKVKNIKFKRDSRKKQKKKSQIKNQQIFYSDFAKSENSSEEAQFKKFKSTTLQRLKEITIERKEQQLCEKSFEFHQFNEQESKDKSMFKQFSSCKSSNHNQNQKEYQHAEIFNALKKKNPQNQRQKSKSSGSDFFKSQNTSINCKKIDVSIDQQLINARMSHPLEQWSLFRGDKGQQYLYMSEEFL